MAGRKSPAKVEGPAREAAEKARANALEQGASEEAAGAAAEAAAEAVRRGDDPELPAAEGTGSTEQLEELGEEAREDLLDRVIPDAVATRLAKEGRRQELEPSERRLLAEACFVFGINPDPSLKPRELAGYRHDAGDPDAATPVPAYVSIVTAGGLKVRYPIDEDTELKLRTVYNCFRANPRTGEREVLPLPPDLTLPRQSVDGQVRSQEHQYRNGYLREGEEGRQRRAKLDELRRAGKIR